jgi:DNA-binding transcriptional ArsR family regulator
MQHLIHRSALEEVGPLFQALGHPLRLRILDFLDTAAAPQRVTEIVAASGVNAQSIVSQQLKILRDHGIVQGVRKQNNIFYSITNAEVPQILRQLRRWEPSSSS